MPANLKQYYLTQAAFWLQQFLVLVLKLERPRSDFTELCIHHVVTLWLIGYFPTLVGIFFANAFKLELYCKPHPHWECDLR
jgi:very-long-chain ceramide synthase